jgi:hypothetical protein
MFGMWDLVLMCIGLGMLIGVAVAIIMMIMSKRMYPYLYVNFEKRQGAYVGEILKGRMVKDKTGVEKFVLRRTVIDSGIAALFGAKDIIANIPERSMGILKKTGGMLVVSNNPIPNTYMPCNVEIKENPLTAEFIVKDIDPRNWYKITLEQQLKHTLLNPKSFLGMHPEIKIIAAGVIFVMIMVIYAAMLHPLLMQMMSDQAGAVLAFTDAINNLAASLGQAGTTVLTPQ